MEGLVFLTTDCLQWLFQQIKSIYPKAAIIWDYWPDDICERSQFFKTVLEYFKQSLPENVNAFVSNNLLDHLTQIIKANI